MSITSWIFCLKLYNRLLLNKLMLILIDQEVSPEFRTRIYDTPVDQELVELILRYKGRAIQLVGFGYEDLFRRLDSELERIIFNLKYN